jgi:hypothetical protein
MENFPLPVLFLIVEFSTVDTVLLLCRTNKNKLRATSLSLSLSLSKNKKCSSVQFWKKKKKMLRSRQFLSLSTSSKRFSSTTTSSENIDRFEPVNKREAAKNFVYNMFLGASGIVSFMWIYDFVSVNMNASEKVVEEKEEEKKI